jgi:hypothetical protein
LGTGRAGKDPAQIQDSQPLQASFRFAHGPSFHLPDTSTTASAISTIVVVILHLSIPT